ncbi:MAG: Rpp14/Pop5 family protein [Candidatus Woesearchaeota archaeon]
MKTLPKHARISNRYILCRIECAKTVAYEDFSKEFRATIRKLVGIFGLAKAQIRIIKNQYSYPYAVVQTKPQSVKLCQAACAYMDSIQKKKVRVQTIITSGHIQKIKESVEKNGHANNKPSNDGI